LRGTREMEQAPAAAAAQLVIGTSLLGLGFMALASRRGSRLLAAGADG
jgi:hypothetical protein